MSNIEKVEEISQEILDIQSLTDLDVELLAKGSGRKRMKG